MTSWWGYGAPILAAATGVVVESEDDMPDQMPVSTITPVPGREPGNHVVEDIGGGRYILYAHMKPGSIPSWVRKGARLTAGVLIGRLGSSGNSGVPHLHFQVMDSPSFADSTGLPFVFDTQLLAGTIAESAVSDFGQGAPVTIDRTEAGVRRNQMSARDGVFGYNLSPQ